jgi:hypothetical protein
MKITSLAGRYKYYILVPVLIVLALVLLLILAPGSGREDPFFYQFF